MAKTAQKEKPATSNNESKKQQKKQARQEAKAMLKLEQAKQDAQKAEQKAAKAQALLEARRTSVRKLEAKVAHTREPHQLPLLGLSDAGADSQSGQHDLNGHTDIDQEQQEQSSTDDTANSPEHEEIHETSEDTNQ